MSYFKDIESISYEGPESKNPLSYRYYNPDQVILGKTMAEHLRIAVCAWHTFCWQGDDNFGQHTFQREWLKGNDPIQRATNRIHAAFEFISKLNVPFFTFHDRDVAPESDSLKQSNDNLKKIADVIGKQMQDTGVGLLWGTANLFSHPRYLAGAATNPDPDVFAYATAQVKTAFDVTHQLGGENYVLWGGREGYDTLLNTDMKFETEQYARFLHMLVDYKHKVGFKGLLLIEPKPCEPTKHQYDFDSGHVLAFLKKYGLEGELFVNIEANHATLAGHSFAHEVAYACAHNLFGSIDANRGDPQLGWDTDQFPIDIKELAQVIYIMLQHGGFTSGGFNFDTKLRRQSIDLEDIFYGHISGIDTLARALLIAANMLEKGTLSEHVKQRYNGWQSDLGKDILADKYDLTTLTEKVLSDGVDPKPVSGRQELLENLENSYLK
ncbi:MAG: xylose isomerase [Gammaproteobacteria bacterium]|nr:xylose isomerase [Gammaproteobacteria bacterium]